MVPFARVARQGAGLSSPPNPKLPNSLPSFLKWCDANPGIVAQNNEDSLVNFWAHKLGYDIWHPMPTIINHDLGVPSTYANDAHHEFSMYRRPTVTWRDVELRAGMKDTRVLADHCRWGAAPPRARNAIMLVL